MLAAVLFIAAGSTFEAQLINGGNRVHRGAMVLMILAATITGAIIGAVGYQRRQP